MTTEPKKFDISVDEIIPQGEMMLIEPLEFGGEQVTKSGIHLGTTVTQATPTLAKVIRSGPDAEFKPGSYVIFRRYSLDEIELKVSDGKRKFNFVSNEDIIGEYKPNGKGA